MLIDNILDTCNTWLNGRVPAGHLLGARAMILEEENDLRSRPPAHVMELAWGVRMETHRKTKAAGLECFIDCHIDGSGP